MGNLEYRIDYVHFDKAPNLNGMDIEDEDAELVKRLNELGRDGWRVVNVDLRPTAVMGRPTQPVLLVREVSSQTMERERIPVGAASRGR
jgi:hypothetical protein